MNFLHRIRFILFGVTAVALIVAMVFTLRSDSPSGGDVVRGHLGPTPGPNSEKYIESKQSYLDALAETEPQAKTAALISLKTYADAPGVQVIASNLNAVAVWVQFPSAEAELLIVETTIAGAVADGAAAHRKELDAEVRQLEEQAATATGAQKTELTALIAERREAVKRSNADCLCVFAFSVEDAELRALTTFVERPVVRLVDVPDPMTNDLSGWELQPIVPTPSQASGQAVP